MPSLIDYLLKPWKFFGAFFENAAVKPPGPITMPGSKAAASAAAQAVAEPVSSGLFCQTQDMGGQILHTCSFAGYHMPAFIFFASLMIMTAFAAASFALLWQCTKLARVLGQVSRELEKFRGDDALPAIRKIMTRDPITEHCWQEFEDTLLISPETHEVFTTRSAESVFSKAALIEDNVHGAFFAAVPGILTGLGLLMTFIAILDGLSHVTVTESMDVQGIAGLINGLSGKFVSSIVAVLCAVSFVFVERIAYSRPTGGYRRLIGALSKRFKRRTTEQLLFELHSQLVTRQQANNVNRLQAR